MRVILCKDYEEISEKAAAIVKAQIILKPDCVLGLATGSTPKGLYKKLIEAELDFSRVKTYNLDEYYPIKNYDPQSYHTFMEENLFSKINVKRENTHLLNGECKDVNAECENFEKMIEESGGIDLQLLGIGRNGHIGFNEPAKSLKCRTHVVSLTQSTIEANSRFFDNEDKVPKKALTMGVGTILSAGSIIIMANGTEKHEAVKRLLDNEITTEVPATVLKAHRNTVLICDREAYYGAAD